MGTNIDLSKLSFAELKQIATESNAAVKAKREEALRELVATFRKHLEAGGFTLEEALELLRPSRRGPVGRKKTAAARKTAGQPKYQDPKSGKTWTGHGRAPDWIKGKNREKFAI